MATNNRPAEHENKLNHPGPVIAVTGCLLSYALAFFALFIYGFLYTIQNTNQPFSIVGALLCFVATVIPMVGAWFFLTKAWDLYHFKQSAYLFVIRFNYNLPFLANVTKYGKALDSPEVRKAFGLLPLTPSDKSYYPPRQ